MEKIWGNEEEKSWPPYKTCNITAVPFRIKITWTMDFRLHSYETVMVLIRQLDLFCLLFCRQSIYDICVTFDTIQSRIPYSEDSCQTHFSPCLSNNWSCVIKQFRYKIFLVEPHRDKSFLKSVWPVMNQISLTIFLCVSLIF